MSLRQVSSSMGVFFLAWGLSGSVARAESTSRADRIKVAVLDLTPNAVSSDLATSLTSVVASELERLEVFSIISRQDIAAMLSHEAEKQALGCDAGSSCMADIGGALGVRYLVSGAIGRIGDVYSLTLSLSDVEKTRVEGRVNETVREQSKLLDVTARASKVLVGKVLSERQGTLLLSCAEAGASVKIDGQIVGVTPLPRRLVTWGPHLLEVEKAGFITAAEDFSVQTKGVVERAVTLIPSPDFLASYEGSAGRWRLGAWLTTGAALVAFGTAGYFQNAHWQASSDYDVANRAYETHWDDAHYQTARTAYDQALGAASNARISAAIGALFTVGTAWFWIAGEDPDRYARFRGGAPVEAP